MPPLSPNPQRPGAFEEVVKNEAANKWVLEQLTAAGKGDKLKVGGGEGSGRWRGCMPLRTCCRLLMHKAAAVLLLLLLCFFLPALEQLHVGDGGLTGGEQGRAVACLCGLLRRAPR